MELISKQEIIDRLDNVIENGALDSNGFHPLSAEAVREMVEQLPPTNNSEIPNSSDTISRQAAIDSVCKYCEYYYNENVIQSIKEIPSAQSERWIPCSERLPVAEYGESDNVLATCEFRNADDTSRRWVKTLYFNGGVWCYPTGEPYEQKVIAWMPLPEPYKEVTT